MKSVKETKAFVLKAFDTARAAARSIQDDRRGRADLRWTIEDIQTIGDQIVVRGKATGTPTGKFWGANPTGKSFNTMAIDIFTVKDGKLASAYHVENWVGALQQLAK
jgi:predicted ester cyclase